jgi:hypothetical protein
VIFGAASASLQLYAAVFVPQEALPHPLWILAGIAAGSVSLAAATVWPRRVITREFAQPEMRIVICERDLFDFDGQIVVGFSDTFDTDTSNSEIISAGSVQGQLLARRFEDDPAELDRALDKPLRGRVASTERRSDKPKGKLRRYPIGTVAAFRDLDGKRVYGVAYTRMGNNLVAQASVHDLWVSLGELWDAVFENGQLEPVAMPLVGSQLARIQCMDRESLLRMVLLSFVARSREQRICRELVIAIHPSEWEKMNSLEMEAFLRTL